MEQNTKRSTSKGSRFRMSRKLWISLIVLFSFIFAVSSFMLVKNLLERQFAVQYYEELRNSYEPNIPLPQTTDASDSSESDSSVTAEHPEDTARPGTIPLENPKLIALRELYPDVISWITVPGTQISYPIVQSKDNDYYLRRDLKGNYLVSGTIFMDYRNNPDFSDFKTVVYGHYMKNGTMFGDINLYNDSEFLSQNTELYISLSDVTYRYAVYAYMVIGSDDTMIYTYLPNETEKDRRDLLTYIRENARFLNEDIKPHTDSHLLILSTCSYEYEEARMILVCVAN